MLEPVDLNVKVKRNLASSWYHKLPIADVDGSLPAVKVFGLIVFLSMQNIWYKMVLKLLECILVVYIATCKYII